MDDPKGYGPDVIKSVAPWILNVYSQNQRVLEGGKRTRAPLPSGPQQAGIETCVVAAGRSVTVGSHGTNVSLLVSAGLRRDA